MRSPRPSAPRAAGSTPVRPRSPPEVAADGWTGRRGRVMDPAKTRRRRITLMLARIYRPAKTAMQSGKAKTHDWRLEFEPASARTQDPLTGWTSTTDMNGQVRLSFET